MVDPDNIVLEHLHIRGVVDGTRDDIRELKHRVGSVERDLAQVHVKVAKLSERVDRLSDRLEQMLSIANYATYCLIELNKTRTTL